MGLTDTVFGTPPKTSFVQTPGTRDPGYGFAKDFFSWLPSLMKQAYPQYQGNIDPGMSPTMQDAIRRAQGYAQSGPSEILQGAQGSLGRFMSPQFQNPFNQMFGGSPNYSGVDPGQRIFGGQPVGNTAFGMPGSTGQGGSSGQPGQGEPGQGGGQSMGVGMGMPAGGPGSMESYLRSMLGGGQGGADPSGMFGGMEQAYSRAASPFGDPSAGAGGMRLALPGMPGMPGMPGAGPGPGSPYGYGYGAEPSGKSGVAGGESPDSPYGYGYGASPSGKSGIAGNPMTPQMPGQMAPNPMAPMMPQPGAGTGAGTGTGTGGPGGAWGSGANARYWRQNGGNPSPRPPRPLGPTDRGVARPIGGATDIPVAKPMPKRQPPPVEILRAFGGG